MKRTIGTCGNCGGAVTIPDPWWGVTPPRPSCDSCGATPRDAHGPRIPMNPPTTQPVTCGRRANTVGGVVLDSTRVFGPRLGDS